MSKYLLTILIVSVLMQSFDAYAAGAAVKRRQQMQAMQQQAMQEAVMQQQHAQAVAQQQAQGQAQAQQVAQYQAQQQAIQQQMVAEYQQRQMQAQVQQILVQVQQEKAAYAQAKAIRQQQVEIVDAQQMAVATAMAAKYQEAIMQEAAKQKLIFTAAQMAQIQELAQAQAEIAAMQTVQAKGQAQALVAGQSIQKHPYEQYQIEDVVDIAEVWRKLDTDSRPWTLLVDEQAKVATVSEYVDRFLKTGIRIQGSPNQYVQLIDQMAVENPALLTNPFKNIMQLVAVMQYDFDNGMDKDTLARTMLGQQMYEANKRRLGR